MTMQDFGWAVIAARHGIEDFAARRLREAGYRTYLPMVRHVLTGHRTPRGRGEVVLRPMLTGYLFAWLDEGQAIVARDFHFRLKHWCAPWDRRRAFVSDAAIELLRTSEAIEGREAAILPRSELGTVIAAKLRETRLDGVVRKLLGKDRLVIETISGRRVEISEADVIRA